jgi:hypothetical protein
MRSLRVHPFIFYLLVIITFWTLAVPSGVVNASDDQSTSTEKKQKPYALIFGTVWDAQDRPVYGVRIKIRRDDQKKAKWNLVSDHRGEFAQRVPAGKSDYIISADIKTKKGSKPVETTAHIENDERIDVGLHLIE